MKTIAEICAQLAAGEFEFSRHAFRRAIERNISEAEIRQAGRNARMIEDYADDKYTPRGEYVPLSNLWQHRGAFRTCYRSLSD
ncbi:MAG: DUF4258 domain-containing protein [Anaerolineae bacterium]